LDRRGFLGSLIALVAAPAVAALPSARALAAHPIFTGALGSYFGISIVEHIAPLQHEANKLAVRALEMMPPLVELEDAGEHYVMVVRPETFQYFKSSPEFTRPQPGLPREKPGRNLADRRRWKGDAWAV